MSRTEKLSAQLHELDKQIEDIGEQRIILYLTHPISLKHHRLLEKRDALRAELKKLNHNVIAFHRIAPA